ncbi:IclR family transcriptional regulator [Halalkalibacter krulwichiae]|uniref:Glycerol operon regulatory protein n=1 Tax=Halalkalibacter krulwichiae TaxID=199441 RepID=A0A1X9ML96_9BACI|nr:IclR family transcriptional regulator [Halalkalibacter krulwichiae]ARK32581.1 Transcriptional regulator KdgR [Halalkalibacter krulwichiae]
MSERHIQSVVRAADILELFLSSPELSIKEVSERMGLSKSTVHGIIKTLEFKGFLAQDQEDQKYKLGMKLFELGNSVSKNLDIASIARPIIQELVDKVKETVHLVILDRGEAIYVEKVEGSHSLSIYSQIGKRAPIHCTGVGKAILAFRPENEIDQLLSEATLTTFTDKTMTDKEQIIEHLRQVKKQGYAIDDEEIEIGLRCIAAPIFNHKGESVASISCAAPTTRFNDERLTDVVAHVKASAEVISRQMGYKPNLHL